MPNRKLTYATAMKIRELLNEYVLYSSSSIIKKLNLNVSISTIDKIRQNRTYKNRIQFKASRLNDKEKQIIRNKYKNKRNKELICVEHSISLSTLNRLIKVKKDDYV